MADLMLRIIIVLACLTALAGLYCSYRVQQIDDKLRRGLNVRRKTPDAPSRGGNKEASNE